MKAKLFSVTLAAAIVAGGSTLTPAQVTNDPTSIPLRGQIRQRIAEKLNLTDDQKAQIKTVWRGEKDTLKNLVGRLQATRKNLRAAIRAGDANETAVRAAAAKVAAVEGELAVERMNIYGKIAPILTDAQRQQISELEQRADEFADNAIARISEPLGD
ncbi:MAG TPA: Spy/CpxP family protein refolding chaperone [Verrucomicrobiae bacterium]